MSILALPGFSLAVSALERPVGSQRLDNSKAKRSLGRMRRKQIRRRLAASGKSLRTFPVTDVVIFTERPLNSLRTESILLEVLGAKKLLTGLGEVPTSLLQGESEVELPEKREHELQLGDLAVLVQGRDVDIVWKL